MTQVKYMRRFVTGEYEFEEFTVMVDLEETSGTLETMAQLKKQVEAAQAGETEEPKPKKRKTKPEPEAEEPEAEAEEEAEEPETEEPEAEEEEEEEDDKGEPISVDSKGNVKKRKKNFKKKPQTYQRNDTHKEIFSGVLKAVAPDWKKTQESKAKAKSVSQKMEGEEFLDEEGEVLPEFKAEVKKLMGKK